MRRPSPLFRPYGGVIPEMACRAHVETIWDVLQQALDEAKRSPGEIDAIAVTQGPGLPGALLIGVAFAKGLALSLDTQGRNREAREVRDRFDEAWRFADMMIDGSRL